MTMTDRYRAVILAAGRGSRLGDLTSDVPKCLTELAGRPLLYWQLAALRQAGVEDVTVVGGYQKECLAGDFSVLDNPRWAESNMVRSLLCAAPVLRSGDTIVSYSDIVYHPDHVAALLHGNGLAITYDRQWLSLWSERFDDPLSDAETFRLKDGRLASIGARTRSLDEIEGQYMGLLRFCSGAWAQVEQNLANASRQEVDKLDMTGLLQRLIGAGVRVRAVGVDGRWCEVDTQSDLELYQRRVADSAKGAAWSHDWRW